MEQTGLIAAIDFGSSKIIVMVGRKNREGKLSILDNEEVESGSCIRRGRIYNLDEVQKKVRDLVWKLEHRLSLKIEKMYAGLGGQSLQTELCTVIKDFSGDGEATITEELIQSLRVECESYERDVEVLDIVSAEFYLDDNNLPETDPVGKTCSSLEVHFKLIVAQPAVKKLSFNSLEKAHIDVAGYVISPIATANAVLSKEDKMDGCALVEIGAEITYVSIYKQGVLKQLNTIPLGGDVITKDIASLKIPLKEAEKLKIEYGNAIANPDEGTQKIRIQHPEFNGPKEIERSLLDDIIEARTAEIIANVEYHVRSSEYGKSLNAGIILTGGGSRLNKMRAALKNNFKSAVRLAVPDSQHFQKPEEQYNHPAYSEIIGILLAGTENCTKEKEVVETIVSPPPPTEEKRWKQRQQSLFGDDEVEVQKKPKREKDTPSKKSFIGIIKDKVDIFAGNLFDSNTNEQESDNIENKP